jgi:linoleoyl-CoA desaturase
MWKIHGKTYDLTEFMQKGLHPGGSHVLALTRGVGDLTPMFETYHAFAANRASLLQTLAKYEVPKLATDPATGVAFDFDDYHALANTVLGMLPSRAATKPDMRWVLQNTLVLILLGVCTTVAFFSSLPLCCRVPAAAVAGMLNTSIGFNILHDASHYAVSTSPAVNEWLSKITNAFVIWNSGVWFYHHVYYHHSFTGMEKLDPDMYYYYPLMTKTTAKKGIPFTLKHQDWLAPLFLFVFPGLYVGHALSYVYAVFKYKYCVVRLPKRTYYDALDLAVIAWKLWTMFSGGLWVYLAYHVSINTFYALNIVGDHDTMEPGVDNHLFPAPDGRPTNWLEMQVRNSSNFVNQNLWWTYLFGGINYQIEHHLFPNVSHIHYPKLAPVVRLFCKKRGIPYTHHDTLGSMLSSHLQMLRFFRLETAETEKTD